MEESKELIKRSPTPEMLISEAIKKNIPVETMEKLLAMRRELKEEQAKEAFFLALAQFQAECPTIPKTSKAGDGSFSYHYASLDKIIEIAKPHLQVHQFSYTFNTEFKDNAQIIECTLHHEAGHYETSSFRSPIDSDGKMNVIQKSASAVTYGKRYAFCNATGIMTGDEDNDAQSLDNGKDINVDKQAKNHVQGEKSAAYIKMENQILEDIDQDIFTGKIEIDGEPYDLDKVTLKLKDDLSNNVYKDGLSKVYDMIARMSLIAQERDAVNVDLINEDVLSDEKVKEKNLFDGIVDNVKKEGNLSE